MEPYASDCALNGGARTNQEIVTPRTSPTTTQKALTPAAAPMPVKPSSSHADSPVARAEKDTTQYPSFFPATK